MDDIMNVVNEYLWKPPKGSSFSAIKPIIDKWEYEKLRHFIMYNKHLFIDFDMYCLTD